MSPGIGIGISTALSRGAGGAGEPSIDADAQVVINAMSPTPDATRQGHINDLVVALKNAGVWAQLDFLHVLAAHSEASALINWVNPGTHNATAVNAPTFTVDRGFAGDGSTSYLNTNFTPSTDGVNYTLNDVSFGAYSRTDSQSGVIIGARHSSSSRIASINPRAAGDVFAGANQDSFTRRAVPNSLGLTVARRAASNAIEVWKNGAKVGTTSTIVSSNVPNFAMYVLAANEAGSPTSFSNQQCAADFAAAAMSEAEQLALYNAVQDFMTDLGANV